MSRDLGHSQDRLPIGLGEGVQVVAASRLILPDREERGRWFTH